MPILHQLTTLDCLLCLILVTTASEHGKKSLDVAGHSFYVNQPVSKLPLVLDEAPCGAAAEHCSHPPTAAAGA